MTKNKKKQQGIVLVLSLIILLAMTLIGVSGMQSTSLEATVAGNMRDKGLSSQAAASALIEAETVMGGYKDEPEIAEPPARPVAKQVWGKNNPVPTEQATWPVNSTATHDWWVTNGIAITTPLDNTVYAEQPRHITEYWSFHKDTLNMGQQNDTAGINYYKITSWGVGAQAEDSTENIKATASIHQTTYAKRF